MAEYDNIAKSHGLPTGEWVRSILEQNKYSYGKLDEPTETEMEQMRIIKGLQGEKVKLILAKEISEKLLIEKEAIVNKLETKASDSERKYDVIRKECNHLKQELNNSNTELNELRLKMSKMNIGIDTIIENNNGWHFMDANLIADVKSLKRL